MKLSNFVAKGMKHSNPDLASGLKEIFTYLNGNLFCLNNINKNILYKSKGCHGQDHIERVLLLGTLIAAKERLNKADFAVLLPCLKYHDIGRIDDSLDDDHGLRGAVKAVALLENKEIKEDVKKEDFAIVHTAITNHSICDTWLQTIADKRTYKIAAILKDADGLDRVRLHDLDPKYLRTQSAHSLVNFAQALLKELPKKGCTHESND